MRKILWAAWVTGMLLNERISLAADEGPMAGMTAAHNLVRSGLGLPGLAWSDDLAAIAQDWAQLLADTNECRLRHRKVMGKNGQVYGENLFWASALRLTSGAKASQKITPQQVVASWTAERQDYDHERNRCRWGKSCGHYTQVVWQTSRRIGCGMAACSDKSQVWVCNYDPPGNYVGQAPY